MTNQIEKLYQISKKKRKIILGLMSGTSLDGLDMALCEFKGNFTETDLKILNFHTEPYADEYKRKVLKIFSKRQTDLQNVCILNNWIARYHATIINSQLKKWGVDSEEVHLIASHGQTIYHAPKLLHKLKDMPNATLQIGDGDQMAAMTGIITISDFRQKHIANGGEGAPLVVYGDFFMASSEIENRALLNIGGVSNLTYLSKSLNFQEVICSDIGPGNTILDTYIRNNFSHLDFDIDSQIARKGTLNTQLLQALLEHSYFSLNLPKTTGPELFGLSHLSKSLTKSRCHDISKEDVVCTLTHFSAKIVADFIDKYLPKTNFTLYVSGGGLKNPMLIELIEMYTGKNIFSTEQIGFPPDAKEAILFACLANETICGNVQKLNHQDLPFSTLGKISLPQ